MRRTPVTRLSNTFLLQAVWAVAITGLMLLSAAIANAQEPINANHSLTYSPSHPILTYRGYSDDGLWYLDAAIEFQSDGTSEDGRVWLVPSDQDPRRWQEQLGNPALEIDDTATIDFNTGLLSWVDPAGEVAATLTDMDITHNGQAVFAEFSGFITGDGGFNGQHRVWVIPEASAATLLLIGLVCCVLGRNR